MKLKHYIIGLGTLFTATLSPLSAAEDDNCQGASELGGCEDCDECDEEEAFSKEKVQAWLKEHAPHQLGDFEAELKEDPESAEWLLKEISKVMREYAELAEYDADLAKLFLEVEKLEGELEEEIYKVMEADEELKELPANIKPMLKELIIKKIKLEKGYIAYTKWELDQELKELEKEEADIDNLVEEGLKDLLEDLKEEDEEDEDEMEDGEELD